MSNYDYLYVTLVAFVIKLLLLPSYHSTDFEVHRNWLAIVHSLPIDKWYPEERYSIWTLDYPPFFAYFEYLLSRLAYLIDPNMLILENIDYKSTATIYFQRSSVIVSDLVICFATFKYLKASYRSLDNIRLIVTYCFVIFNAGLMLVDNIHFQYNGYLLGILVMCFYFAAIDQHVYLAATFSFLVLSKHLFLPLAFPMAIYLLRRYCFPLNPIKPSFSYLLTGIYRLSSLVFIALSFIGIAFVPFLIHVIFVSLLFIL